MEYRGRYQVFDPSRIKTYPLCKRTNKVKLTDILDPATVPDTSCDIQEHVSRMIDDIACATVAARQRGQPVILFTGAHLVKNGLSRLVIDLVSRGIVTLVAGNGATAIHDFELALIGETSEDVPDALERGEFGMAHEFIYMNTAMLVGNTHHLGLGETLGKMICEDSFREEILSAASVGDSDASFEHPELSILATCYEHGVPFTVHVGIGTDVTDQHASFDGAAKGGCSGRDFLIYANEVTRLTDGGIALNIGSAVTGPEVLLKAVSMAANAGAVPAGIMTADFDLRPHAPDTMTDESADCYYYFRDQKSVVTRIPSAFDGRGYYVHGNQKVTVPFLYKRIIDRL